MNRVPNLDGFVLLGAGGANPRVEVEGSSGAEATTLLSLSPGSSVYAIARSTRGNRLAIGTKAGKIYLLDAVDRPGSSVPKILNQGAPVLSLAFVDDMRLCSSDTAGRCLVWELPSPTPQTLSTEGKTICALVQAENDLVGLSECGFLMVWRGDLLGAPEETRVGEPISPLGLVRGAYWAEAGSVVFPLRDGSALLYSPEHRSVRTFTTHEDRAFAVTTFGRFLATAGHTDGVLKLWEFPGPTVQSAFEIPKGIIAIAASVAAGGSFLLIMEDGAASYFQESEGQLVLTANVSGSGYRTVVGAACTAIESAHKRQREEQARSLFLNAAELIERKADSSIDKEVRQLESVGYPHLARYAECRAAASRNDILAVMEAQKRLVAFLPDKPPSRGFLLQMAETYRRLLLHEEALETLERANAIEPTPENQERLRMTRGYVEALVQGSCIVVPEEGIGLTLLIEGAKRLGRAFTTAVLMRSLDPVAGHGVQVSIGDFVAAYDLVRQQSLVLSLPTCQVERFRIIEAHQVHAPEEIAIFEPASQDEACVLFGLRFLDTAVETLVTPILFFRPAAIRKDQAIDAHAAQAIAMVRSVTEKHTLDAWIRQVHKHIEAALGRLISEAMAKGRRSRTR